MVRAIVTCGPSFEPIDEVRRITNFSTGELGTILTDSLVAAGVETVCLRGVGATYARMPEGATIVPFTTNDDLQAKLAGLSTQGPWHAVFHAAALADYRLASIEDEQGSPIGGGKIRTGFGGLTLRLVTTAKLLPQFREWFPVARIIGWKYEMDGTQEEAMERGRQQILKCQTDACVVNGRAYGPGFGLLEKSGTQTPIPTKELLARTLAETFCSE